MQSIHSNKIFGVFGHDLTTEAKFDDINLLLLILNARVKELWENWSAVFRKPTKMMSRQPINSRNFRLAAEAIHFWLLIWLFEPSFGEAESNLQEALVE